MVWLLLSLLLSLSLSLWVRLLLLAAVQVQQGSHRGAAATSVNRDPRNRNGGQSSFDPAGLAMCLPGL